MLCIQLRIYGKYLEINLLQAEVKRDFKNSLAGDLNIQELASFDF
jgi:hypothetical protein